MRWQRYALIVLVPLLVAYVLPLSQAYPKTRKNTNGVTAAAHQCYAGHSRYEEWHGKVVLPYESSAPQSVWADRVRKLHAGQSTAEVLSVFGEPDYVGPGAGKKSGQFLGCYWVYNARLLEDNVNYKRNSWVEIFFDRADGKVVNFDAVNIGSIPNRPFPSPTQH